MVELDEYRRPPTIAVVRQELERLAAVWEDHQRTGRTTSFMQATGMYPVTGYLGPAAGPPTGAFPLPSPGGRPTGAYPTVTVASQSTRPHSLYMPAPPAIRQQTGVVPAATGGPVTSQAQPRAGLPRWAITVLILLLVIAAIVFCILISTAINY